MSLEVGQGGDRARCAVGSSLSCVTGFALAAQQSPGLVFNLQPCVPATESKLEGTGWIRCWGSAHEFRDKEENQQHHPQRLSVLLEGEPLVKDEPVPSLWECLSW